MPNRLFPLIIIGASNITTPSKRITKYRVYELRTLAYILNLIISLQLQTTQLDTIDVCATPTVNKDTLKNKLIFWRLPVNFFICAGPSSTVSRSHLPAPFSRRTYKNPRAHTRSIKHNERPPECVWNAKKRPKVIFYIIFYDDKL